LSALVGYKSDCNLQLRILKLRNVLHLHWAVGKKKSVLWLEKVQPKVSF